MPSTEHPNTPAPTVDQTQSSTTPEAGASGKDDSDESGFPLMGVGISAGGLEPLGTLLGALGSAPGLAVVVVPHLDPSHESQLVPLLRQKTSLPVQQIATGMRVQVDHVYVLPPNTSVTLEGSELVILGRPESRKPPHPIDRFFRSLADTWGPRGIGVVLSGALDDGTDGLQHIRSAGGFAIAQDPETAEYRGMPESAIAAGAVDLILEPAAIGRETLRLVTAPYVRGPDEAEPAEPADVDPDDATSLERIFGTLHARTGNDFSAYKRSTVLRRIQRRMTALRATDLPSYALMLRALPDEAAALRNDLLINVTRFFRDWDTLGSLDQVLAELIQGRPHDDPIRIWVAGCATGEEAYSLAISVMEALRKADRGGTLQVFGTDVNDAAIHAARRGHYPMAIEDDVPAHLLSRYFERSGSGYQVNRAVRAACIFAVHDMGRDPPFSRMDLASCRNVLIYMQPKLQRQVLSRLHYALKPTGFLTLGSSEAIGRYDDMFVPVNKNGRIFRRSGSPSVAAFQARATGAPVGAEAQAGADDSPTEGDVRRAAERHLLERFAPAAVLIDHDLNIHEFLNDTSPYLVHGPGPATLNLMRILRDGLGADVRNAIREAQGARNLVRREGIQVQSADGVLSADVEVQPVAGRKGKNGFLLVTFQRSATDTPQSGADGAFEDDPHDPSAARLQHMERELETARDYLQAIVEDYEATNEELQSANEEAMSTNEELQSTNEELETAREELQSTNEELTTLNEELVSRNDEVQKASNDVLNLLNSVNIPIVMLDGDLRIRRFTTAARRELHLIPGDAGRPLADIALPFDAAEVDASIKSVMETLQRQVLHLAGRDGDAWIVEITPYRTTDDRIDGVVLVARRADAADAS